MNSGREREDEKDNVLHWNKIKQERLKDMQQKLEGRIEGLSVNNDNAQTIAARKLGRINRRLSKRMENSRTGVKGKESKESKSRKVKVSSGKGKGETQTERGNSL